MLSKKTLEKFYRISKVGIEYKKIKSNKLVIATNVISYYESLKIKTSYKPLYKKSEEHLVKFSLAFTGARVGDIITGASDGTGPYTYDSS